jgi:heme-degrading monooxygenase HmoA
LRKSRNERASFHTKDALLISETGFSEAFVSSREKRRPLVITRMIVVKVPQDKSAEAERLWKEDCAPLMIKQPGCVSEEFLKGRGSPGEYISLSKWENQEAIDRYRGSDAHKAIQQHTRGLMNVAKVEVKEYEIVG